MHMNRQRDRKCLRVRGVYTTINTPAIIFYATRHSRFENENQANQTGSQAYEAHTIWSFAWFLCVCVFK